MSENYFKFIISRGDIITINQSFRMLLAKIDLVTKEQSYKENVFEAYSTDLVKMILALLIKVVALYI